MKAVVVEIKKRYAAVLSDDGSVKTIKNNRYEIGQVIQLTKQKVSYTKKLITIAASAAAFVILSVGTWAYASPYLYVSVDVNPSVEYTVNRFDRVLTVKAINDDGEEIIDEISLKDLKNKTIEAAITETVQQITKAGYINDSIEGGIVITTASEDEAKADELADALQTIATQEVAETAQEVTIEAYSVGLARVEKARELGVTPGKLNLVEKLQAAAANSSDINLEEWLNKPVRDIMRATKEYKAATAASDPAISKKEKDQIKSENKKDKVKEDKAIAKEDNTIAETDKAQSKSKKDKTSKADQGKQANDQGKSISKNDNKQSNNKSNTSKKADTSSKRSIKDTVADPTTAPVKESKDKSTEKTDKSSDNSFDKRNTPDNSGKSDTTGNQSNNSSNQSDNPAKQSDPFVKEPKSSEKQSSDGSDNKGNSGNDLQGSDQGSEEKGR